MISFSDNGKRPVLTYFNVQCPRDVEEGKTNSVRLMFSAAPS